MSLAPKRGKVALAGNGGASELPPAIADLAASPKGKIGNAALTAIFLELLSVLKPSVFCDVGSLDGSISLAVHTVAPNCEVHAFEANPESYRRYESVLTGLGIDYRHLAITDRAGPVTMYVPVNLHGSNSKTRYIAKTSLLPRSEAACYDKFEVEAQTLDGFFAEGTDSEEFFLWIDVEGAAEHVLAGAKKVLQQTLAVFVECEGLRFWRDGANIMALVERLRQNKLIPIVRDREYGDEQFNVLFVDDRYLPLIVPALRRNGFSSLDETLLA